MAQQDVAPLTSVFRTTGSRKIRRNRQALSCASCQKRKSRCDRRRPCGGCEARGDPESCHFGPVAALNAGIEVPSSAAASRQSLQSQLSKLEDMVKQLARNPSDDFVQGTDRAAASRPLTQTEGTREAPRPDGEQHRHGGVNYHGETSWSALVESIRSVQNALTADEDLEVPEATVSYSPDAIFGDLPPVTTEDILEALPPRQDADKLVSSYFNAKFLAVPILHTHQFKRHYEKFWDAPASASLLWVSILFSILSTGVVVCRSKAISLSSPDVVVDTKALMSMAARCLVSGNYVSARPWSVEAMILYSHCRSFQKQDSDPTIWTLYAVAVRLAQRQGYHRDAGKISGKITPFQAEMRRRVWFAIESYDLLFSYQHGLPPMTHEDSCDVGHPKNLADEDFDEDSTILNPRSPTDPLPILANATKSRMLPIFRRMLRHAIGVRPETPAGAIALGRELDAWYETIPRCLTYRSIRESSFTDSNHTVMHRIMLELMFHLSRCVLWRSYMLGGADRSFCQKALNFCRESALKMLEMHIELDRELQPGGRLHEDRYMVSSLALHSFLVAAMIICLELTDHPKMK